VTTLLQGGASQLRGWLDASWLRRLVQIGFVIGLYALGLGMWWVFYGGGRIALDFYDWNNLQVPYLSILRESLSTATLPLFISSPLQGTTFFLANPEVTLSPQIILLTRFSDATFVLINTMLLYSVGYVGMLLIYRRYRLSLPIFGTLTLLFCFNGHIVAHLATGHSGWNGYFLLPFLVLWTFDLVETGGSTRTAVKIGFVLWGITLQGGIHLFAWCLMFLAAALISARMAARYLLLALLIGALFALHRLLPAATAFLNFSGITIGYTNSTQMLEALLVLHDHRYLAFGEIAFANLWAEYDIFIGLAGALLLGYFGIYQRLHGGILPLRRLDFPLLLLTFLSLSRAYQVIQILPIPLLSGQRTPSRFLILPLVFLLVIAARRAQVWFDQWQIGWLKWIAGFAIMLIVLFDVYSHTAVWALNAIRDSYTPIVEVIEAVTIVPLDAAINGAATYQAITYGSYAFSLVALLIGVVVLIRRPSNR